MKQDNFEVREYREEMVNIPNSICQDWFTRWIHRLDEPFPTWDWRRFQWLETDLERSARISQKKQINQQP